ncbi:MAG: glycosyltransferase family 2 protein, partial [Dysgonamonadaceae bacterium]|nr:glycosyltransferase family 2 protein [Dysgonamonadaceae bacterium]
YNEQNSGSTFKQWIKGINAAKGEYIWLAESDDWAENDFLQTLVEQLEQNSDAVLAFCLSNKIDENGEIIEKAKESNNIEIIDGEDFIRNELTLTCNIGNASMVLFKKSNFDRINHRLFENMKYNGDWFVWSLMCETGMVMRVNKALNNFRIHKDSVTSNSEKQGLSLLEGFEVFYYNRKHISSRIFISYLKAWIFYKWANISFSSKVNRILFFHFLKRYPLVDFFWFYGKTGILWNKIKSKL